MSIITPDEEKAIALYFTELFIGVFFSGVAVGLFLSYILNRLIGCGC